VRLPVPHALAGVGLLGGLIFLLLTPLPFGTLNGFVGGAFLVLGVASVAYMIVVASGPGGRRPDF